MLARSRFLSTELGAVGLAWVIKSPPRGWKSGVLDFESRGVGLGRTFGPCSLFFLSLVCAWSEYSASCRIDRVEANGRDFQSLFIYLFIGKHPLVTVKHLAK